MPFMKKKWKNFVERGGPHDYMAHAHSVLDAKGYKHAN